MRVVVMSELECGVKVVKVTCEHAERRWKHGAKQLIGGMME